jgi:nitroreductase/dihydropteridine reductase
MDNPDARPDIARLATTRHTCKAFDPERKISPADLAALLTVLRYAPSSVNSQPWHFILADSEAGKARIAEATRDGYAYNEAKLRNASHAVVLCARLDLDEAYLAALLAQEDRDGRFPTPEARANQDKSRHYYVHLHRDELRDAPAWMEKQVYLALGMLLQGAAALGIDACPIEGFDRKALDATLGLRERGLTAVVLTALGYRGEADFNARLPKSRLPEQAVFTYL